MNYLETFGTLYHPVKAFVVYKENGGEHVDNGEHFYVEAYDMDNKGCPINAHPLSIKESSSLSKALDTSEERRRNFLKPAGLLPPNVRYINPEHNGYAIWQTPQQRVNLLFTSSLGIPDGKASIPSLVWKASKESLHIYAVKDATLNEATPIYHAPFFNIYKDGKVCMGTVSVTIAPDCLLEEFIRQWEHYFFNSYFSHLMQEHIPVKNNIVQLWQSLVNSRKKFPVKQLITNGLTLKDLIR